MGSGASRAHHALNDFELVIRSAKELESILVTHFGASGKGLQCVLRCAELLFAVLLCICFLQLPWTVSESRPMREGPLLIGERESCLVSSISALDIR